MHVVKKMVRSPTSDVVFLQKNCPINVHQAMMKEQKVTILFKKKIPRAKTPLKIQASLNHLLGLFPMGCNQDKYCIQSSFSSSAVGRGGDTGEDAGGTRGGHPPYINAFPNAMDNWIEHLRNQSLGDMLPYKCHFRYTPSHIVHIPCTCPASARGFPHHQLRGKCDYGFVPEGFLTQGYQCTGVCCAASCPLIHGYGHTS